jgi:hypothetical protein
VLSLISRQYTLVRPADPPEEIFANKLAAALCADTQERQKEILDILDRTLAISQFPSRSILDDLVNVWSDAK